LIILKKLHLDGEISVREEEDPQVARAGFDYLVFLIGWKIWKE